MIHSDLLNSLTDNEKVMVLACIRHATKGDYKYTDIQYMRTQFFREVLEVYYNIVASEHQPDYKEMVDKINPQLTLL